MGESNKSSLKLVFIVVTVHQNTDDLRYMFCIKQVISIFSTVFNTSQ